MSTNLQLAKQLEEDLRALSVEARKKYPMVKEAAERSIIKLRAKMAKMLREARSNSTASPQKFQVDEELLRPFVLACNHADVAVKLAVISLSSFQRLLSRGCVEESQYPNIVRVLRIQSLSHEDDILLRILQTLPLILSVTEFQVPEDSLRQALLICAELRSSQSPIIVGIASATLRQLLTVLYDRVEAGLAKEIEMKMKMKMKKQDVDQDQEPEQKGKDNKKNTTRSSIVSNISNNSDSSTTSSTGPTRLGRSRESLVPPPDLKDGTRKHAYMLFQDLCLMGKGESGVWLGRSCMTRALATELLEEVLTCHPTLFHTSNAFGQLIKNHVCPLLIRSLRSQVDFTLMVRLMRLVSSLVVEFHELLHTECEIFVTLLLRMLPHPGEAALTVTPLWHTALTLEALKIMCENKNLLKFLYQQFDADADNGATQIFANICKTLSRFVTHAFDVSDARMSGGVGNGNHSHTTNNDGNNDEFGGMDPMGSLSPMTSSSSMRSESNSNQLPLGVAMDQIVGEHSSKYSRTDVMHAKERSEPPEVEAAAVVLCAHECSMCIVKALTLTVEQTQRMQPMHGKPTKIAAVQVFCSTSYSGSAMLSRT